MACPLDHLRRVFSHILACPLDTITVGNAVPRHEGECIVGSPGVFHSQQDFLSIDRIRNNCGEYFYQPGLPDSSIDGNLPSPSVFHREDMQPTIRGRLWEDNLV